jgi:hypothetical protein
MPDARSAAGLINATPVDAIVAAPIRAMIDVTAASSAAYLDWFRAVCLDDKGRVRQIELDVSTPTHDISGASTGSRDIRLQMPMAAAVDHPNFGPDTVRVELNVEVHSSAQTETETSAEIEASGKVGVNVGIASASLSMSVKASCASKSVRNTDTTSRMNLTATGSRRKMPEGMSRTLDAMREMAFGAVAKPATDKK